MPNLKRMIESARRALENVLELSVKDRVLVLGDPLCGQCPDAFAQAAAAIGCHVDTIWLPAEGRPLQALPTGMIDHLDGCTVVINVVSGQNEEIPMRIEWITEIEERGILIAHSPGITEEMMSGGAMDVDYADMRQRATVLKAAFSDADSVRITSEAGTDLLLGVRGRDFVTDVHVSDTEQGVNLPCGEVYCAPEETRADGTLVIDGSFGGEGNLPAPLTLKWSNGRVGDIHCEDADVSTRVLALLETDDAARTIAELGIGLNPGARLIGNMLEDEKALRTIHIAFGGNQDMPGGCNVSKIHVDGLVHKPTLVVTRVDGTELVVLKDGEMIIPKS
jgi:leucyl aminopeptidase (aminopeptidase T)